MPFPESPTLQSLRPPPGPPAVTTIGLSPLLSPFCLPVPVMAEPETPSLSAHLTFPSLQNSASESGTGRGEGVGRRPHTCPHSLLQDSVSSECGGHPAPLSSHFHRPDQYILRVPSPSQGRICIPPLFFFFFCSGPSLEEDSTLSQLQASWGHPLKLTKQPGSNGPAW